MHVIPSQMIKWYNTCSLIDGKDASVYLIDWIPTHSQPSDGPFNSSDAYGYILLMH